MNAGILLMIAYWVIFTVRKHFTPKLAAAEKANTYDLNRDNPEAKWAAQRRRGPLAAARWALRVADGAENVLAVLMIAWLGFLLGCDIDRDILCFRLPRVRGGAGGEKPKVRKCGAPTVEGLPLCPDCMRNPARRRRPWPRRRNWRDIGAGAFHHGRHRHEYSRSNDRDFEHSRQAGTEEMTWSFCDLSFRLFGFGWDSWC